MTKHILGQDNPVWGKFVKDENGFYYNIRMEQEKEKRINYCKSRTNNKIGVNQWTKNSGHMTNHKTLHMGGHMENENINENTKRTTTLIKEVAKKKQVKPFSSKPPREFKECVK